MKRLNKLRIENINQVITMDDILDVFDYLTSHQQNDILPENMLKYDFNKDGVVDIVDLANIMEKFQQGPYNLRDESKWRIFRKHLNMLFRERKIKKSDVDYLISELESMHGMYYDETEYNNNEGFRTMYKNTPPHVKVKNIK